MSDDAGFSEDEDEEEAETDNLTLEPIISARCLRVLEIYRLSSTDLNWKAS